MRSNCRLAWCAMVVTGAAGAANAQTVWDGPPITFAKSNFADWNLEENQDRITDNVWLTRKNSQGLFNIAMESGYGPISPLDTEWATGDAADWQSLTFQPWVVWHGGNPPGVIGVDAVLHLITDDIYIDITFLSWTCCEGGGGFSYMRSTIPAPAALPLLALGVLCKRSRRRMP